MVGKYVAVETISTYESVQTYRSVESQQSTPSAKEPVMETDFHQFVIVSDEVLFK